MPVTFKSANIKYKDSQGQYVGINAVSDHTTAEQLAAINAAGTENLQNVNNAGTQKTTAVNNAGAAQIQAIEQKGIETRSSIPPEYSE